MNAEAGVEQATYPSHDSVRQVCFGTKRRVVRAHGSSSCLEKLFCGAGVQFNGVCTFGEHVNVLYPATPVVAACAVSRSEPQGHFAKLCYITG